MSAYSNQVIADGAVAYWRLDEPSGTTANSLVGSYPGTISGGVTVNQPGGVVGDAAMTFDGTTGDIAVADNAAFGFADAFSLECWVKASANAETDARLIAKRSGNVGYELLITTSTGEPQVFVGATTFGSVTATGVTVQNNAWHHLVATRAGTTVTLYVDGVSRASSAVQSTGSVTNAAALHFGRYSTSAIRFLNGTLDDIAIYPVVLTPAQIATHYTLGTTPLSVPVVPPGRIAGWTPLTPSDTVDAPFTALWVGGAGVVAAVAIDGTVVTFTAGAGAALPLRGRRVNATNTTAAPLLALTN
jgi:hypothetical protein